MNSFIETIKNNTYALKLMWKICSSQVIHKAITRFLGYFEWLFYSAFFMKHVINSLVTEEKISSIILFVVVTIGVFGCISLYNSFVKGVVEPLTQVITNREVNTRIFSKAMNVELSCFEDDSFYNKYLLAIKNADEYLIEIIDVIWGVFFGAIATCVSFYFLYTIDKWAILFVVFPIIGNFVFNKVLGQIEFKRNKDMAPYNRKIDYINRVMYLPEYAKEIRLTNVFKLMKKHYNEAVDGLINSAHKYTRKGMLFHWLRVIFTFSFIFEGLLIYGAYRSLVNHALSLAELSVITSMMVSSTWILIGFTESLMKGYKNGLYVWNLRSFLEHTEKIPEDYDGIDPGSEIDSLEFRNVSFMYKDTMVIHNLSFRIKKGKVYALVGHNGAGKSTIIKLLMRYYDPTEGEILCNGKNIKEYNLKKYRALFGTAFQNCCIFSMSIAENILLRQVNEEDRAIVIEALKNAHIYEKVKTLAHGIDTMLTKEFTEEGAILSGGELQKIGVARAFARQCSIKIFDEPSSALDPISEYYLFDSIRNNCKMNTIIFISHRLSSVQNADWVFLLEEGTIKEEGSHNTLMKQKGIYADMYTKQAENYLARSSNEINNSVFNMQEAECEKEC